MNRPQSAIFHFTRKHSRDLLVALCITCLVLLTKGYQIGTSNHVTLLPSLFHLQDHSLFPKDPIVQSIADHGPRIYYLHFLALASSIFGLGASSFILTLASLFGISLVLLGLAQDLKVQLIPAALSAFLFQIYTPDLIGGMGSINGGYLLPELLAMPVILLSLRLSLQNRIVLASGCALLAGFIHPLVAFVTCGIGLAVNAVSPTWSGRKLAEGAGALFAIAFGYWLIWHDRVGPPISSSDYIHIVGSVRHPHHYIPSWFPQSEWLHLVALIAGGLMAWWRCRKSQFDGLLRWTAGITLAVVLIWVATYFGTEVLPNKLLVSAQTWRFSFLIAWACLILMACASAKVIQPGSTWDRSVCAVSVLLVLAGLEIQRWETLLAASLTCAVAYFATDPKLQRWNRWVAISLVAVVTAAAWPGKSFTRFDRVRTTINELVDPVDGVSRWCQRLTPADALFVIPPDAGRFRVIARRSAIVDWKTFPFDEPAIPIWMERIEDCYGKVNTSERYRTVSLMRNYHQMSDERLQSLHRKYGATHALLFSETATTFPTLYSEGGYKVVQLGP